MKNADFGAGRMFICRGMWYNNRKYSTGGNDFGKEKTIEKG